MLSLIKLSRTGCSQNHDWSLCRTTLSAGQLPAAHDRVNPALSRGPSAAILEHAARENVWSLVRMLRGLSAPFPLHLPVPPAVAVTLTR